MSLQEAVCVFLQEDTPVIKVEDVFDNMNADYNVNNPELLNALTKTQLTSNKSTSPDNNSDDYNFTTERRRRSTRTRNEDNTCKYCKKVYKSSKLLKVHLNSHQEVLKTVRRSRKCKLKNTRENIVKSESDEDKEDADSDYKHKSEESDGEDYLNFQRRRKRATIQDYPCEYCFKGYSSTYTRDSHVSKEHSSDHELRVQYEKEPIDNQESGEFTCRLCNEQFPLKYLLVKHVRTLHPESLCSGENLNRLMGTESTYVYRPKPYDPDRERKHFCHLCNAGFLRKYDRNHHIRRVHPKGVSSGPLPAYRKRQPRGSYDNSKCDVCGKGFLNQVNMLRHRKTIHENEDAELETEQKVDVSSVENSPRKRRKRSGPSKNFICPVCYRGYHHKGDMLRHCRNVHGDSNVGYSQQKNDNHVEEELGDEVKTEEPTDDTKPVKKRTRLVKKSLDNMKPLPLPPTKRQLRTYTESDLALIRGARLEDGTGYQCLHCPKISGNPMQFLHHHHGRHTGERNYTCEHCGKSFHARTNLKVHLRIHDEARPAQCPECPLRFINTSKLATHMETHGEARNYVCDECGKSFKQDASLRVHKMYHTNEYPYACEVCGKRYRLQNELKRHGWLHTGERPYECEICGSRFRLSGVLKKHRRTHGVSGGVQRQRGGKKKVVEEPQGL